MSHRYSDEANICINTHHVIESLFVGFYSKKLWEDKAYQNHDCIEDDSYRSRGDQFIVICCDAAAEHAGKHHGRITDVNNYRWDALGWNTIYYLTLSREKSYRNQKGDHAHLLKYR